MHLLVDLANWSVPIFYLVLMTVSVRIDVSSIIMKLNLYYWELPVIWSLLIFSYIMFFASVLISPGIVDSSNFRSYLKQFKPNNIIYFEGNECGTCKVAKIPRSKHCSVCNKCVLMEDHHCIWLNNCIGLRNYKYFIGFLASLEMIFVYGLALNVRYLLSNWKHAPISSIFSFNNIKSLKVGSFKTFFKNYLMIYVNFYRIVVIALKSPGSLENQDTSLKFSVIFSIICAMFAVIIVIFSWNVIENEVFLGMTQNERYKWFDVHDLVETQCLFKYYLSEEDRFTGILKDKRGPFVYISKRIEIEGQSKNKQINYRKTCFDILKGMRGSSVKKEEEEQEVEGVRIVRYYTLNEYNRRHLVITRDNVERVEMVRSIEELDNVYDKGIRENIMMFL